MPCPRTICPWPSSTSVTNKDSLYDAMTHTHTKNGFFSDSSNLLEHQLFANVCGSLTSARALRTYFARKVLHTIHVREQRVGLFAADGTRVRSLWSVSVGTNLDTWLTPPKGTVEYLAAHDRASMDPRVQTLGELGRRSVSSLCSSERLTSPPVSSPNRFRV